VQFDVIILGGGPSGSAAALMLARAGVSVLVIERARSWQTRPGETLPPAANGLLRRLGVWEDFLTTRPVESPGNLSLWGDDVPRATDSIFSPQGSGWHVDRAAFDGMLAHAAERQGAVFRTGATALRVDSVGAKWHVQLRDNAGTDQAQADWLIVASGRGGRPLIHGAVRERSDHLCACFALMPFQGRTDARTWLEAASGGWWYSAPVPDGRIALAFFTDADLLPGNLEARRAWLASSLIQTHLMRERVPEPPAEWRIADAHSGRLVAANIPRLAAAISVKRKAQPKILALFPWRMVSMERLFSFIQALPKRAGEYQTPPTTKAEIPATRMASQLIVLISIKSNFKVKMIVLSNLLSNFWLKK
jgi:2-polyprenyl-6-methoxyphenol hydroxylase-like FAD-dependent oxidoreductase